MEKVWKNQTSDDRALVVYESITEISDHPIDLYVRFQTDIAVTKEGSITFDMLKQRLQPYVDEQLKKQMENIVQESL